MCVCAVGRWAGFQVFWAASMEHDVRLSAAPVFVLFIKCRSTLDFVCVNKVRGQRGVLLSDYRCNPFDNGTLWPNAPESMCPGFFAQGERIEGRCGQVCVLLPQSGAALTSVLCASCRGCKARGDLAG